MRVQSLLAVVLLVCAVPGLAADAKKPLRAGMIGLDTSHCMAFTKILNDPKAEGDLAGVKIVAAFPGGTPDNPASWDRVKKITEDMRAAGVEICDSIPAMLAKVDVVFLESVDGRPHLAQATPVLEAKKPLFIDKPAAGSLVDAVKIYNLAAKHKTPVFSSSSLRFGPTLQGMLKDPKVGPVRGAQVWSPCSLEPHHPDFFWYGIHGVEMLYTVMGAGCVTVTRIHTEGTDMAVGVWKDGRIGSFRGLRDGKTGYGAIVFGAKGIGSVDKYEGYAPLVQEVCKFFKSGKPPVSAAETIELLAFMEAADQSKAQGGCPVKIADVLAKAQKAAAE